MIFYFYNLEVWGNDCWCGNFCDVSWVCIFLVYEPPLAGVYGVLCWMFLVGACVLLKINLYFGNDFWIYLVDLLAVSLVSWIEIVVGVICLF